MKDDKVPEYVMARIERLFKELSQKKDKDRAMELKAELDKWGLYEIYEKRFLNLFKNRKTHSYSNGPAGIRVYFLVGEL